MIEPLETYYRNYNDDSQECLSKSNLLWNQYQEAVRQSEDAKKTFFELKEQALEQEKEMEKAMVQHEQGALSTEKVQKISKRGVTVKYKAEVASQTYKKAVENLNTHTRALHLNYSPGL